MSVLEQRQLDIYNNVNELYLENSSLSLEKACNDLNISKQTYYNYKKKFGEDSDYDLSSSKKSSKPRGRRIAKQRYDDIELVGGEKSKSKKKHSSEEKSASIERTSSREKSVSKEKSRKKTTSGNKLTKKHLDEMRKMKEKHGII